MNTTAILNFSGCAHASLSTFLSVPTTLNNRKFSASEALDKLGYTPFTEFVIPKLYSER